MLLFLKKLIVDISYLSSIPAVLVTGASGYAIWAHSGTISSVEHNYLARLKFNLKNNGSFIKPTIEGKEFDFSNEEVRSKAISETRDRLLGFYRKYGSRDIKVNLSKDTSESADYFLHIKSFKEKENTNNLWLDNVKLNQLSIDRYGTEFDESGVRKTDSNYRVHSIVKWSDVGVSKMNYKSPEKGTQAHLLFNFYNSDIPIDEVRILTNEDENKYKKDDSMDSSNDWFVWLDKDLLALRINYVLQTYVFSNSGAETQNPISSIVGFSTNRTADNKNKYEIIQDNLKNLTDTEKEFAENYIRLFIDVSGSESIEWSKVVSQITNESYFIKPDDINRIYNRFTSQKKDTSIFEPYLITIITSGKEGSWKKALNLSENKEENDNKSKKYEIRAINKINSDSSEEELKKNSIKIFHSDILQGGSKLKELHELITKYSVRYFNLIDSSIKWTSSVYSPQYKRTEEIFYVITIPRLNEYGI